MRKLWLAVIALSVFASVSAFASAANYLSILGNGIIAEKEQLDPFNPAGIQFTNSFAMLELYDGGTAAGVTDPTGSLNVMFAFPMVVSVKFNDLLGFRLGVFNAADTAMIPAVGAIYNRMNGHTATLSVVSPFALTWGMKAGNLGFGVKYELQTGAQGKWADDNFTLAYSLHKIEPGVRLGLGGATIDVIGDFNLVLLGWSVATTNTTGNFVTNTVTAKSPLELMAVKAQITYPLFAKLLLSGRVEGGLKIFGYDEKYVENGGNTLTNDYNASLYFLRIFGGLKYSPIALVDAYFDIGTKLFGQNVVDNEIGTGVGANSTNTNVLNQITVPSIAVGVALHPSIFTISLGLSQDIIASSSPITNPPSALSTGYELDPLPALYTSYQGNTMWTMLRKASLGVSINLNPIIIEAICDISQTAFLGQEFSNPLNVLGSIFSASPAMGALFTGVRCSVLF